MTNRGHIEAFFRLRCVKPVDVWPWTVEHTTYKDPGVWSPRNEVHVWKSLETEGA